MKYARSPFLLKTTSHCEKNLRKSNQKYDVQHIHGIEMSEILRYISLKSTHKAHGKFNHYYHEYFVYIGKLDIKFM